MAAPMRDTSAGNPPTTANFEYDDNEWDIGIGDLIIDLDADIEKTGVGEGMAAPKPGKMHSPVEHQATVDKGLKMKIKRTKPGTKHEIVKSGENGEKHPNSAKRGSSGHRRDKKHGDKPGTKDVNGMVRSVERVVYPVGPGPGPGPPSQSSSSTAASSTSTSTSKDKRPSSAEEGSNPPAAPVKKLKSVGPNSVVPVTGGGAGSAGSGGTCGSSGSGGQASASTPSQIATQSQSQTPQQAPANQSPPQPPTPQPSQSQQTTTNNSQHQLQPPHLVPATLAPSSPPPLIQQHTPPDPKELVDVCVGTSIGTITEPDCLGPCEPGTSVTLEGIVWHETEGVLVVNVTWRGKTYVGTLLDCTRHDWAPPRFCDSPTSDIDARAPKGRGKRGRNSSNNLNDLSNFTETRSSVHSKLRSNNSAGPKGRKGGPGSASPTPFAPPKTDTTPGKRKTKPQEEEPTKKKPVPPPPPQPASPLAPPVLLECPEPNCSKKYKHINGLKYHQSHAHGSPDDEEAKESGMSEEEVQSPAPEIKKEDLIGEISTGATEEAPEPEEKSVLRFAPEEAPPLQTISNPVPAPLVVSTSTPPPISTPPDEQTILPESSPPGTTPVVAKVPQFKVKTPTVLIPEEKKQAPSPVVQPPNSNSNSNSSSSSSSNSRSQNPKKKNRKSPSDSPHPSPLEPPALGIETGREDVQSPAYSDISDDAAPLLESEVEGKPKPNVGDKKEPCQSPQLQHYGMYPYYGQPPYLVPSVPEKAKENTEKTEGKPTDKEKKEPGGEYPQKLLPQHYYQYGYVQGYSYNVDGYPVVLDETKKEEKAPVTPESKQPTTPLHIPNPTKSKPETALLKDKHQNDNHQILKESIEMKNQLSSSFVYQRQPPAQEDMRRYYIYDRKEGAPTSTKATPPPPQKVLPSPSPKHKEKQEEKKDRREDEKKQEGVKPTMETQGPPPPPTSQYAYIHPGYMQSPHYGLPFDPGQHPMYRGMNPMLVSGYTNSPYLHPQLHPVTRYHAPEDLSRPQSGKALDLLQHHASQYFSHPTHKIHELQERAIKSPTPKTSTSSAASPSGNSTPVVPVTSAAVQVQGKPVSAETKDTRSPPPQRHVHTHHHTHVGLGYPILAGQYPAPYGAAVLASEHAAAVTSVPYQAK